MMMEDILYELREVEAGHRRLERPLAKEAADALVMMVDRVRYLEEKVKEAEKDVICAEEEIRHLQDEFGV